jgi:predicted DNA-binding protein
MRTIYFRIDDDLNRLLDESANFFNVSKSQLIKEKLIEYLEDWEDLNDAKKIASEIDSGKMKTVSSYELKKSLGI